MAERKRTPAGAVFLGAWFLGTAVAAGCCAGAAALMVSRGIGRAAAWPLSAAAVCLGSFAAGWLCALWQKSRGLFWGMAQGAAFAAVLAALALCTGGGLEEAVVLRMGMAALGGCAGGMLGVLCAEKRRR